MKPNQKIDKLFAQTKPVCFGRFLIDVPATAQVVWGTTHVNDAIISYPGEGIRIPAEIQDKEKTLKDEKHIREPSTYIGTFDGSNPKSKIVVGYSDFESSGLVQLNSYLRIGKHGYVQRAPSAVLGRDQAGVVNKTGYQRYVAEMQDIGRRLRVREENEMPSEAGVCLMAGFVAEADGRYHELVSIGFRFPEYPDVSFSIRTIKTDRLDETNSMEWALKSGESHAKSSGNSRWFSGIQRLREGARQMGDWAGGELLARAPVDESGGPSVHRFLFRSVGVANDPLRPIIDMSFSTGVDGNEQGVNESSLKDEDAVALWDKLTASIRVRPTRDRTEQPASDKPVPRRVRKRRRRSARRLPRARAARKPAPGFATSTMPWAATASSSTKAKRSQAFRLR